ncbi:MAG: hypothetical protein K2N72_14345 [Oscillospiraceae bacterium]|nr:hypothetical protein [Oscillospiraceae bacterium]
MSDTKKIVIDRGDERLIRLTVRFSKSVFYMLKNWSKKYGVSLSYIVRLAMKLEVDEYLKSIRYIDVKQAAEILDNIKNLTNYCKEIQDKIRCIGISYNTMLRLKNTEKKHLEIYNSRNASGAEMAESLDNRKKIYDEIEGTRLNTDELKIVLEQFENAAEKAVVISCRIHE